MSPFIQAVEFAEDTTDDGSSDGTSELTAYLELLEITQGKAEPTKREDFEELQTTPLFTWPVKTHAEELNSSFGAVLGASLKHYAVLGYEIDPSLRGGSNSIEQMPVFLNINAPWSAFICGSQGSGKSHTLSCMLENCLLPSPAIGSITKPLAGIVFHYDPHAMESICEAAYLCSDLPVTILTSPSNFWSRRDLYARTLKNAKNVKVQALTLSEKDLNTQRMLRLMAVSEKEGPMPLYMEVVMHILKTMAIEAKGVPGLNYQAFKRKIGTSEFSPDQRRPLQLRLNLLESFLTVTGKGKFVKPDNNVFHAAPGSLTIVDLTDPFVDPASACVLFDICLALFVEKNTTTGHVFALDEAHKYMNASAASQVLTESIITLIREQRHRGARIIISTQEPTISPKLLDLCSMTFAHRFTSPDWLATLQNHIAGASTVTGMTRRDIEALFRKIVELRVGESMLFAPAAMLDVVDGKVKKLGSGHVTFKTRKRITEDGGRSILVERVESSS